MKRQHDLLTDEQRQKVVNDIVDFYATERDEEIGVIGANEILDVFLESAAISIYNQGVEDTKQFLKQRFGEIDFDIEATIKKSTQ